MILVDTSVWIAHLRAGNPQLTALLRREQVLMHPAVFGELACGGLRNRALVLALLRELPRSVEAEHEEVLALLEREKLSGTGIGWIDAHLLASARLSGANLWTLDHRLAAAAERLHLAQ